MTTDYNKTDGHSPTTRKLTGHNLRKTQESVFTQTTIPTNIHTANIILTNIILMADKHNIPRGKMHSKCRLIPEYYSMHKETTQGEQTPVIRLSNS